MKCLLLSDLHLEFAKFSPVHQGERIDEGVDVVILAGDICLGVDGIRWARQTFVTKEVVYVAGNHEAYGWQLEYLEDQLRETAARMDVHFLERDSVDLFGVRFLGTTLWTDFEIFGMRNRRRAMGEAQAYMNDYRSIHTSSPNSGKEALQVSDKSPSRWLTAMDTLRLHRSSVAWLEAELAKSDPATTVVVTHHAPHRNSVHPRYARDLLTGSFASNLEHLMSHSAVWVHGHMHSSFDYTVNGTRVVCNPRGYPLRDSRMENDQFNPCHIIEI